MITCQLQVNVTASSGQQVEGVGGETRESGEVSEVDGPLDEEDHVDNQDEGEEQDEWQVVEKIILAKKLGNLLIKFLPNLFLGRGFGWYKPFPLIVKTK